MMARLVLGLLVIVVALVLTARNLLAPGSGNPPVWVEPFTGMEFVLVPAQLFQMGSPDNEYGRQPDETLHPVDITRAFYIGRYEVTQGEWWRVMETRPSQFGDCDRCPIERVSFLEVQEFVRRLRARTGAPVRLPTEAEWELSCRSGGGEPFGHRSTLSARDANIDGGFPYNAPQGIVRGQPTTVGRFAPTPWGLFDMTGNVWEWVEDRACPYPPGRKVDPLATCASPRVVIRGGSWNDPGAAARCSHRAAFEPHDASGTIGFRLAKDTN